MLSLVLDILTTYVLPGLILGFGVCFLCIAVPASAVLQGYRKARRMMGGAYLAFFVALVVETIGLRSSMPSSLQQMLMVTIGIVQAFFFTFALITLLDVRFFTWRRIWHEVLAIVLPASAAIVLYQVLGRSRLASGVSLLGLKADAIPFVLLILFYGYKLADYVVLFRSHYRTYERRMSDFYSDDEHRRLYWVKRSFYSALSIGILALLYALRPSIATSLIFSIVLTAYYTIFAVRFINYAFAFQQIEAAMSLHIDGADSDVADEVVSQLPFPLAPESDRRLIERLYRLMTAHRLYAKPDLTIEEVAVHSGESYRAISAAINSCEHTTFKSWVNTFRISEAERLIRSGYMTGHTTDSLARTVGFANRISFYRVFKRLTGTSPTDYC